ncbi:MAG: RNA-directed DNA polymerase [Clostridia bacterium]
MDGVALRSNTPSTIGMCSMGKKFDESITFRNLYRAMQACARNVMWKDSVAGYAVSNGMENTFLLRKQSLTGTYRIDPYQRFFVFEPKKRPVTSTRFKDRQFQRAFCDGGLYEDMTRPFIRTNCACQRGRGVDDAMDMMDVLLRRYYNEQRQKAGMRNEHHQPPYKVDGWVLCLDVRKFFPSTPHDTAKDAILKRTRDMQIAAEACAVVESFTILEIEDDLVAIGVPAKLARRAAYAISKERSNAVRISISEPEQAKAAVREARENIRFIVANINGLSDDVRASFLQRCTNGKFCGIGLGSQVSQLVELAVLDSTDHFVKEQLNCRYYGRYMDDFRIISDSKERLRECWKSIEQMINSKGLELNQKSCIYPLHYGVKFLQWKFVLTDTGKVIRRISHEKLTKERRCLRKLKNDLDAGERTMKSIEDHYQSFCANLERGNTSEDILKMDRYYKAIFGVRPIKPKKKGAKKNGRYINTSRAAAETAAGE